MDRGAWWAAVHGVTKSWTRLSDFTLTFHFQALEKEMATHSSVPAWRIYIIDISSHPRHPPEHLQPATSCLLAISRFSPLPSTPHSATRDFLKQKQDWLLLSSLNDCHHVQIPTHDPVPALFSISVSLKSLAPGNALTLGSYPSTQNNLSHL